MTDPSATLANLRRPRLLVRAARHGLGDYSRERMLSRLLAGARPPSPGAAFPALLAAERDLERTRRAGDGAYSVARHVELLIALMAEARLLVTPGAGNA